MSVKQACYSSKPKTRLNPSSFTTKIPPPSDLYITILIHRKNEMDMGKL